MSDAPHVALIVDHPERDLAGLVLTALDLAQRGVVCHLVPLNLQEREIWALEPDFVLFNYLRRSNERFARSLLDAGIAFGVLDTEGAIWPDPDEYAALLWQDVSLLRQARCVCLWGARLADYLVTRGLYARDQIVVTGCPRFDLYVSPWRGLQEDVVDRPTKAPMPARRRILINTNFSVSNPAFTTAEQCVALHRSVLGYSETELRRIVHAETVAIRETVRIAEQLADTFPSVDIVIRPHPFESSSPYDAAAAGRDNLIVRRSDTESIQAAIFSACAVIQRSCTTAIEAGLAGVPAFSPQWMPAPFLMPDAEAVSVPCASFSELTGHLHDVLDEVYEPTDAIRQTLANVVRDCCFAADGLSHWRVAEAVWRALAQTPPGLVDRTRCRQQLYGLDDHRDRRLTRAARHARHYLRLSPDWSFTRMRNVPAIGWINSGKHFDAGRVQRLVNRARAGDMEDVLVCRDDRGQRGQRHACYGVIVAEDHATGRRSTRGSAPREQATDGRASDSRPPDRMAAGSRSAGAGMAR